MLEIRLVMRAAHTLAAAAWVGGSLFYLVVVTPVLRGGKAGEAAAQIAIVFRRLTQVCIGVLLLSGAYLLFDRLTQTTLGWPYLVVLGLKVAAALGMFVLAMYLGQSHIRRLAKRSTRFSRVAPQVMLGLGVVVFMLGALLNILFEATIGPK